MPKLTITFHTDSLNDGFRWADVIDALGAIRHFMKRECVEEGSVYKPIDKVWTNDIFAHDEADPTKRTPRAHWRVDPFASD